MAGRRIHNFLETANSSDLQSYIDELYIHIDRAGWTEAHKILWKNFIFNQAITSAHAGNNYQSISPQTFLASVMSESQLGVGYFASDTEISSRTSDKLIRANKLGNVQNGIMQNSGVPTLVISDSLPLSTSSRSIQFPVSINQSPVGSGATFSVTPALPAGLRYAVISIQSTTYSNSPLLRGGKFTTVEYSGSEVSVDLDIETSIVLNAAGTDLFIRRANACDRLVVSGWVTGVLTTI